MEHFIHSKVGTGNNGPEIHEVQAFHANLSHFLFFSCKLELVEVFSLLINFDPGIKGYVAEDLIFRLQSELLSKFTAGSGTQNVMGSWIGSHSFERFLSIIKNAVALQSTALEEAIIVIGNGNNLFRSLHLLYNFEVSPVKDLYISLIESDKDESIVANGIEDFELSGQLRSNFKLVSWKEVKLHLLVFTNQSVDANKFHELGGSIEYELICWQPVIIETCMFFSNLTDYIVYKVVN